MAVAGVGCASVTSSAIPSPTVEPTPTVRPFMVIPVKEQTFTDESIRSWNFRRDILPPPKDPEALKKYLDPELFGTPKPEANDFAEATCDFSDTTAPTIKGDIDDGEMMYYTPDDARYNDVVIDESLGEMWFCTEQSALDAGWNRPS